MAHEMIGSDGIGSDIEIYDTLFEINAEAKRELENKFIPAYNTMKKVYNELKDTQGFNGKAKEGFMETFEILLRFHEDLNEYLPDIYKSIENLGEDLNDIEKDVMYTSLNT